MFCTNYENAMKILDSEIKLTHELFLDAMELAKTATEESDRKEVTKFAKECHLRYKTLKELKAKLQKEVGP